MAMQMPPWVLVLVGVIMLIRHRMNINFRRDRHRMNIKFWRHALDTHGVAGLDAASRATHPDMGAISTWRRHRAAKKPPALPVDPTPQSGANDSRFLDLDRGRSPIVRDNRPA